MNKPTAKWFLGVDPGERWCGFARLRVSPRGAFKADTGVLDASPRTFTSLVDDILNLNHVDVSSTVITEAYQQRPVGHQRFKRGTTSELIGAIRYGAEKQGARWTEMLPGDPDKELPNLPIGPYLERWRGWWPEPSDERWHHARAAWRVLARYLLARDVDTLASLHRRILPTLVPTNHGLLVFDADLVAPTLTWSVNAATTPRTNAQA